MFEMLTSRKHISSASLILRIKSTKDNDLGLINLDYQWNNMVYIVHSNIHAWSNYNVALLCTYIALRLFKTY
jgi:hypothetical protein